MRTAHQSVIAAKLRNGSRKAIHTVWVVLAKFFPMHAPISEMGSMQSRANSFKTNRAFVIVGVLGTPVSTWLQ